MPELPEIEHLRRSLAPLILGLRVADVRVGFPNVVRTGGHRCSETGPVRRLAIPLLKLDRLVGLCRHGKQLALVSESGRCVCIHLGMSGRLSYVPANTKLPADQHRHVIWILKDAQARAAGRLFFRDPRRFGGIWCFSNVHELHNDRWGHLGPDALSLKPSQLKAVLRPTLRTVKAALLDQRSIAGIGNIYADESLYRARIHPLRRGQSLTSLEISRLSRAISSILKRAVEAGGTTFRDYRDGRGQPGSFAAFLSVYGRRAQPCRRCGHEIQTATIAQRTTHFCPECQI